MGVFGGVAMGESPPVMVVDPDPCDGHDGGPVCGWGNVVYSSLCWMEMTASEEVRPASWADVPANWYEFKDLGDLWNDPTLCKAKEGAVSGEQCQCWEACPKDWRPVCTEGDQGKVYANACLGKADGHTVCPMKPTWTFAPIMPGDKCECLGCDDLERRPVCVAGKVYRNKCSAHESLGVLQGQEACEARVEDRDGDDCVCGTRAPTPSPTSWTTPPVQDCEDQPRYPVCVDKKVYPNKCTAHKFLGALEGREVCEARAEDGEDVEDWDDCECGTWPPNPWPTLPPVVCPEVWMPLCANGLVYPNMCKALAAQVDDPDEERMANLRELHEDSLEHIWCPLPLNVTGRECDASMCLPPKNSTGNWTVQGNDTHVHINGTGNWTHTHDDCPMKADPVCADGSGEWLIYRNRCYAIRHSHGTMPSMCSRFEHTGLALGADERRSCSCAMPCPFDWRPVCAKGTVYGNKCMAYGALGIAPEVDLKDIGCPVAYNVTSKECDASMCLPPRNIRGNETVGGNYTLGGSVVVSMNLSDFQTTYAFAFIDGLAAWYGVHPEAVAITCICEGDCDTATSGVTLEGDACVGGATAPTPALLVHARRLAPRWLAAPAALGVDFEVSVASETEAEWLVELTAGSEAALDLGELLEAAGMPAESVSALEVSVEITWDDSSGTAPASSDALVNITTSPVTDDEPTSSPSSDGGKGDALSVVEGISADQGTFLSGSSGRAAAPLLLAFVLAVAVPNQ